MHTQHQTLSDFKVGVITFTGIFFLILGVTFAGGDKGLLFRKTSYLKGRLSDIGGLKKGATVTMGGMAIGRVTQINFAENGDGAPIEVIMQIRSDMRENIKTDSAPTVKTQGMLGDRYIEICMGGKETPPLPEGQTLMGKAATDFDGTLRQAQTTLEESTKLLAAVNQQQGTIGQIIYDGKLYEQLNSITAELDDILRDFKKNPRRYVKLSIF